MFKFHQKIIKRLLKEKDEFSYNTSQVLVETTLKKDLFNKSRHYKKEVDSVFSEYVDNYIKICKYLYDDFDVRTAKFNNENTELKSELGLRGQIKKIIKQYPNAKTRMMDRFKVNKQIKKWWILSTILENYPDAIEMLKSKSKSNEYKDLNFNTELENYNSHKYLIEDFSIIQDV